MISEALMRPGSWSLRLKPDCPLWVSDLIETMLTGAGGHVVILPARLSGHIDGFADATLLDFASYTGRLLASPDRVTIEGDGLGGWLGDADSTTVLTAAESRTAGTLTQWVGDLLVNGLTSGSITNTSTYTHTFPAYSLTYREALDHVCLAVGAEYRINPDFTVDAAAASTLFRDPPRVVVTAGIQGTDGELIGIEGGLVDQSITATALANAVAIIDSSGTVTTSSTSRNIRDKDGSVPSLTKLISAPSEGASASTVAANTLNLLTVRRSLSVQSMSPNVRHYVTPGDSVYVYDPEAGIEDLTTPVTFRGRLIFPVELRLLELTWPVTAGHGVLLRSNAASPGWTDITRFVEFEDGAAQWTVGTKGMSNGSTGGAARFTETAAAASGPTGTSYTPTLTGMAIGTGGSAANTAYYTETGGLMVLDGRIIFGTSGTTFPGSTAAVSLPSGYQVATMPTGYVGSQGRVFMEDADGVDFWGEIRYSSATTLLLRWVTANATYTEDIAASTTTPFTWTAGDSLHWHAVVRVVRV